MVFETRTMVTCKYYLTYICERLTIESACLRINNGLFTPMNCF